MTKVKRWLARIPDFDPQTVADECPDPVALYTQTGAVVELHTYLQQRMYPENEKQQPKRANLN